MYRSSPPFFPRFFLPSFPTSFSSLPFPFHLRDTRIVISFLQGVLFLLYSRLGFSSVSPIFLNPPRGFHFFHFFWVLLGLTRVNTFCIARVVFLYLYFLSGMCMYSICSLRRWGGLDIWLVRVIHNFCCLA